MQPKDNGWGGIVDLDQSGGEPKAPEEAQTSSRPVTDRAERQVGAVLTASVRAAPKAPADANPLTEYREILIILGVGAMLFGLVALYRAREVTSPEAPTPRAARVIHNPRALKAPAPQKLGPRPQDLVLQKQARRPGRPPPSQEGSRRVVAPVEVPPPEEAAKRMLTVTSYPKGAMVEVNGLARGTTPLVMQSPSPQDNLHLRVTHPGYKKWEQTIYVNESGHFQVKVVLEERR